MADLKTTFTGLVTAVVAFVASLGFEVDPKYIALLSTLGVAVIGFLAKDSK